MGAVVSGALEIVIALVTFDMTHEDSENPLGEDQTFSLERATPYPLLIPGEGSGVFMCDYLLDNDIILIELPRDPNNVPWEVPDINLYFSSHGEFLTVGHVF